MKKFYLSLVVALLFSFSASANNVIVKGYVKYSNGAPAVNQTVIVYTDSSANSGCYQYLTVNTNQNGFYIDTLSCPNSNISKVVVATDNCGNSMQSQTFFLNSNTTVVEQNFTLTCTLQQTCQAGFNFYVSAGKAVYFSSASSSTNGINAYQWNFGDGTTGSGMGMWHTFPSVGTFAVKHTIIASNGCVDSVVQVVAIFDSTSCHAQFDDSMITANHFVFNSYGSTGSPGNTIVNRIWSFGDGTGSNNNQPVVNHTYQQSGTYTVCLKIVTASGCVDSTCKTVTVVAPPANCVSNFTWQKTGTAAGWHVNFNSASSGGATTTDSIVGRYWAFGDGQHLSGNVVSPGHLYTVPGNYQACLTITTASGCQKTVCKTIYLIDTNCYANFNYNIGAGGMVNFINTSSTLGTSAQYVWTFGNNATSSAIHPVYIFAAGTHTVKLRIFSVTGCIDSISKTIYIAPPATNCEAAFNFNGLPPSSLVPAYKVQFNSTGSHATSAPLDSIISRTWIWGDGSSTTGNVVSPTHVYTSPSAYNVCLIIQTASNCIDSTCKTVTVPMQNQLVCQSKFTYAHLPSTTSGKPIKFNSTTSYALPGDSIVIRKWHFGDGSSLMTGNVVTPTHVYQQAGMYNVCLTITTALGCVKTECKVVIVPQVAGNCVPHFTWTKTGSKQISFNSSSSWVPVNDTITERKWFFGDASPALTGNVISPVHNYLNNGVYSVALKIKTALNCEKTFYASVNVQDSVLTPPTQEQIKIMTIYPSPATYQVQAVVWSLQNNIQAELAIYDVYGSKKWSTNTVLMSGNNVTVIPTGFLSPGPYYLRVTTMFGVKSRAFFK